MHQFYKELVKNLPYGYAYHKIITDEKGKPIDYIFLEANKTFENLTGLKSNKIIGKKVTDLIPDIKKSHFDWITLYGNIALNGGEKDFEEFFEPVDKWYKVHVFSPEKAHFITLFTDITNEKLISEAAKEFSQYTPYTLSYRKMAEYMQKISGASYVVLNRFDAEGKGFFTAAIAGNTKNIEKAVSFLGFRIEGKKWDYDAERESAIAQQQTTFFSTLSKLTNSVVPDKIVDFLAGTFNIGQVVIIKTSKENKAVADFTLFFKKNDSCHNQNICEVYAEMVGNTLQRIESDIDSELKRGELEKNNEDTQYLNTLSLKLVAKEEHQDPVKLMLASIKEYTGAIFSIFSRYDTEKKILRTTHIDADDVLLKTVAKIAGQKIFLTESPVDDEAYTYIVNSGSKFLQSLTETSMGAIPPLVDKAIKKATGTQLFLGIALVDGYNLYGALTLAFNKKQRLPDIDFFKKFSTLITITLKRNDIEIELKQSEAKFFAAFDTSPYAMIINKTEDGKILDVNQAFCTLFGFSKNEVLGQSTIQLNLWQDINERNHIISILEEGEELKEKECHYRDKNGLSIIALVSSKYIFIKDEKVIFTSINDITSRKKSEAFIVESEKKYRTILQTALDGFFIADIVGKIDDANTALCNMLGYSPQEMRSLTIADIEAKEDVEEVKIHINEIIRKGSDLFETFLRKKDNTIIYAEISATYYELEGNKLIVFVRDITHRKQIEDLLIESEQQHRLLAENSSDVIWTMDLRGSFTYVSPSVFKLRGYTPEEVMQQNIEEALTKNSINSFYDGIAMVHKMIKEGKRIEEHRIELEQPCKDGSTVWTEAGISGMYDKNNEFLGLLGVTRNISERKHMQLLSEMRLELINYAHTHSLSDLLVKIIDELGKLLKSPIGFYHFVEPDQIKISLQQWSTMTKTQFCNIPDLTRHYPLTKAGVWADCIKTRTPVIHNDYASLENNKGLPKGHAPVIREIVVPVIREGKVVSIVGLGNKTELYTKKDTETAAYFADVTWEIVEHKLIEEEKLYQSNFQKMVADVSSDFINTNAVNFDERINSLLEKAGVFFEVDRSYLFLFSSDGTAMTNTHEWVAEGIAPEYLSFQNLPVSVYPWWSEQIKKKEAIIIDDINEISEIAYKEREEFIRQGIQSLISVPIINKGNIIGIFGFDAVKKRVHWHDRMKPMMQILANIIAEAFIKRGYEKDLIEAKNAAERANRAKSEFLAHMNHELRTPLNGVIGFNELLKNTDLNPIQLQYADNAMIAANSLLGIISDILDYSKIEAGKLEIEIVKSDITELMEQAIDIVKIPAARKNLELLLNIDQNVPAFAYVDPVRLKQILINLLSNAVKFTGKGDVELKLSFTRKSLHTGIFGFEVKDTGIGIKQSQKEVLFKAFSQGDTTITRKYGGTGLGLTISAFLTEKMGGKLKVSSTEGKGSVFYFELDTAFEEEERPDYEHLNNIKSVLVIDDNENNRTILEHELRKWNIKFTGAENAYSAIEYIEKGAIYDVFIVDYNMPYLNGIETIKLIKKKTKIIPGKHAVILLHSSFEDSYIQSECKKLGVRYTISKPVKSRELFYYLKNINLNTSHDNVKINQIKTAPKEQTLVNVKASILIVEDNEMNMWVLRRMLENLVPEANILIARNGLEAVNIVKKKRPDLILMDIQMPEMDGLEATMHIRKIFDSESEYIPILALTAGTTKEEQERCFAAGMNYFISKPVKKEVLYQVIEKYLLNKDFEKNNFLDIIEEEIPSFNKTELLEKFEHNEKMLSELFELSKTKFDSYIENLGAAISSFNLSEIKSLTHSIKGSASNLCFYKLANFAQRMETHADKKEKLESLFIEMKKEWGIVKKML